MISSSLPFPPVSWWIQACKDQDVVFDLAEHYQKMSYRNRYYLAAPSGRMLMSIPLEQGRNQRVAVSTVQISDRSDWQDNHWKTIVSLYGRSPFFAYFEHQLRPLFEQPFTTLHSFNMAGIRLIDKLLELRLRFSVTEHFEKHYPEEIADLRHDLKPQEPHKDMKEYYQVFADRTGFLPDCSVLDLLCCEGMYARNLLYEAAVY